MSIRNLTLSVRASVMFILLPVMFILLMSASAAFAQQSTDQQKCLNKLNKDGTLVAKEQGKQNFGCLKGAGAGTLTGTAQACLTADPKGKLLAKKNKTSTDETKLCLTPPSFGYTSASTVNDASDQARLDLLADVFGADLDAAVISCTPNKAGCLCQQKVQMAVEKLADKKLKEFTKCKKTVLKAGASSASSLEDCVANAGTPGSIAADTKGLIAKALGVVNTNITKKCDTPGVTSGAFPGNCSTESGPALGACLDVQVECRVCLMINEMDGLSVDCDLFDDGNVNGSCVAGPTPTPSPTPGHILEGALPATVGRFNYNLTLGLPGANAACNTNFPGTHACTYPELLQAEGAGDLAGLTDTTATMVTSFWAIDGTQPALQQCNDDAVGGSGMNWEYATAHTASRGQKVALNNGTGALGVLQSSLQCNFSGSAWVGCCL